MDFDGDRRVMDFQTAIFTLNPQVTLVRDDSAYDKDGNEVQYDKAAVQALVDSVAYQSKRSREYPSIVDQLDLLYHGGYDAWRAAIQAVKEKYPKDDE